MKHLLLLCPVLLVLLLTGCSQKEETGTGYLFTCTIPGNPECLDPQYTSNENAEIVIANMMEGLLRLDKNGNILPAGATSYTVSDDGLTYVFTLRNDCYWYRSGMEEKNALPVTSLDYVFAFRRLIDPATKAPHAEDFLCLENASEILDGKQKIEKLGVSAPDGATVIFQLSAPNAEFPLLLTQCCAVPCNEDFFLSTKGRYGLNDSMILCNGAFYLNKWMYDAYGSGNFLTFRKNKTYHAADTISPGSLQFTIMRSAQEVRQDFSDQNTDVILTDQLPDGDLSSATVKNHYFRTWGLIFNPENKILQNISLREALACGIDRSSFTLNPAFQPAYGIIPPAVQLLGRPYRELYADEPLSHAYDPDQAFTLFQEITEEIPVSSITAMKILVPDSFSDTEAILSICQNWQSQFGHYIGIESVSSSEYQKRLASGDYSIALYAITPEQNSCDSVLKTVESAPFYSENAEFSSVMKNLSVKTTQAEKLSLYGAAEKAITSHYTFIPLFYQCRYLIYTDQNTDIWCNPFRNTIIFRDAKHFS